MSEKPHKKLIVWQKAMAFIEEVYRMTEAFPKEERFGLVAQLRRAAVSIASNIAEGAARRTWKEAIQAFYIARGSVSELDTQLEISHRLHLIDATQYRTATEALDEIGRLLNGLISSKREPKSSHSLLTTHYSLTH